MGDRPHMDSQFAETKHERNARLRRARLAKAGKKRTVLCFEGEELELEYEPATPEKGE